MDLCKNFDYILFQKPPAAAAAVTAAAAADALVWSRLHECMNHTAVKCSRADGQGWNLTLHFSGAEM